jgi:hypothetical protein
MQERQVTIERETHTLEQPFMVIATQVQSGGEGTYPLTDVQTDRFLLRLISTYSSKEEEKQIISGIDRIDDPHIEAVTTSREVLDLQRVVKEVYVAPDIVEYITSIIHTIRTDPDILSGPSIRSGIALYRCARVQALLDGRDFVIPDDVKHLANVTIEHRIRLKSEAEMDDVTTAMILERALERVPSRKSIYEILSGRRFLSGVKIYTVAALIAVSVLSPLALSAVPVYFCSGTVPLALEPASVMTLSHGIFYFFFPRGTVCSSYRRIVFPDAAVPVLFSIHSSLG